MRTALLVLSLLLAPGCGVHSPARVETFAQRARQDQRYVYRLIRALRSNKEDVWSAAYAALVELGPVAVGPLEDAIRARDPAAGRAVLVLGELCDPALFPFLSEVRRDPELGRYAEEAFKLAERPLVDRMLEERDLALCDAYLKWYPQGAWREKATLLRHELLAEKAWEELGPHPQDGEILAFLRRYGDTPTGARARRDLSSRYLVDASRELGRGRPQAALAIVDEARRMDPDLDVDAMEAAIRFALGKEALEDGRLDEAVAQLEQARALGGGADVAASLGRAYLDRSRSLFERGQYVAAMKDVRRAVEVDPLLASAAGEARRQLVSKLVTLLGGEGDVPGGVVEALVLAGPAARNPLEAAARRALDRGDPSLLQRMVDAVSGDAPPEDGGDARRWVTGLVERLLSEADGDVRVFLSQENLLHALFHGGSFLDADYAERRDQAARTCGRYVAVVAAAHYHVARLGPVSGPLPASPPLDEGELAELFRAGHDGSDALGLPPLTRVQLLLYQLRRIEGLGDALRERGSLVAAALLGRGEPVFLLPQWASLLDELDERGSALASGVLIGDGTRVAVTAVEQGDLFRVTLQSTVGPDPLPDRWVGASLAVLFSLARPLMEAMPWVERLEVAWVAPRGGGAPQERLDLVLNRSQVARMDWATVEAQPAFTPAHLVWVPGHRLQ